MITAFPHVTLLYTTIIKSGKPYWDLWKFWQVFRWHGPSNDEDVGFDLWLVACAFELLFMVTGHQKRQDQWITCTSTGSTSSLTVLIFPANLFFITLYFVMQVGTPQHCTHIMTREALACIPYSVDGDLLLGHNLPAVSFGINWKKSSTVKVSKHVHTFRPITLFHRVISCQSCFKKKGRVDFSVEFHKVGSDRYGILIMY